MTSPPAPATSWSHNRRHLSVDLADDGHGGREGLALCRPGGIPVNVFDEVSINRQLAPYRGGKRIVVADLPPCKTCARAAAKLEGANQ